MATALQACEALDAALRLSSKTATWHAARLRAAGLLPSTQGKPEQINAKHIAAILVAIVASSTVVSDYFEMPCSSGGAKFGETLAHYIERPEDLFEVVIDANSPAATITFRAADHGIQTLSFEARERHPRPAFDKQVRLGPDVFIHLAAAIKSAPEVRAGRRPLRERYRPYETTTKF
ncbi:hypothetical protein [Rhizobium lusitanum]|uniref:hypothetical protein n=1 Tax=Rhizobium lusitanum TaxID=293958 RepID=UPI001959D27A|nr:hypothetical protein [Rhizobium lusitanum]MBM7045227.1 hypothetical protein [Rhizobium lusitanum]